MKVSPKIRNKRKRGYYSDLELGDVYQCSTEGRLYMKIDNIDGHPQCAVDLETGEVDYDCCDDAVIPVDAVLNWKHKPSK